MKRWVKYARVLLSLSALFILTWALCPKPELYRDDWAQSQQLLDRNGCLLHLTLTADEKYRLHTPLKEISPHMVATTLAFEDQGFYRHAGVDIPSLVRASWGLLTGQRLGGGSTLTMQLARLRWNQRTDHVLGKLGQILRAIQLERHYTKEALLEAYLNQAPYGGNVEGIGAASLLWCVKRPNELTLRDSVALVVLPQSPTRRRPRVGVDNPQHAAATRRLWNRLGDHTDALDSHYSLMPEKTTPRMVPHLARRLIKDGDVIRSTIDSAQQRTVEDALRHYLDAQRSLGIVNGTALLVHAPSREIRAYVGSADFMNEAIHGQVDGIKARRSPGSALKPFIYALALDQGLIHTRTLLKDGKLEYADYSPENYERDFVGPIMAQEALARSRNIPAITLSQQLSGNGLYGFLQSAGILLPKTTEHYGLTLALGGAEVSPEQLAGLYSMLADDGTPKPLIYQVPSSSEPAPILLNEAARFLTLEMLRQPLDKSLANAGFRSGNSVAWKTGTSHGFRDAWCAGILNDYVLVVWLGNFHGKGNPALVGRKTAAPLLFAMFDALALPPKLHKAPATVATANLCAVSGQLPTKCCQHRLAGWFIPGVSSIQACQIHQEVIIDPDTNLRLNHDDGSKAVRREIHEFWPPDLLHTFAAAGLPRRPPPTWAPGECPELDGSSPRIQSPIPQRVYHVSQTHPSISLRADTSAGVEKVFWFNGQSYLGSSSPTDPLLWTPKPGHWLIQVLDDAGRSAQCNVTVE